MQLKHYLESIFLGKIQDQVPSLPGRVGGIKHLADNEEGASKLIKFVFRLLNPAPN